MFSYEELEHSWKSLRGRGDMRVREVACEGAARTLLCAEIGDHTRPCIHIAAGVHGDEPAAPWALFSLAADGLLDPRFAYRVWACTNPSGYQAGTRHNAEGHDINRSFSKGGKTPEARAMITSNRDRKFALALDLHEDFECEGFYCYEIPIEGTAPIGRAVIRALDDAGLPVATLEKGFDLAYPPDITPPIERGHVMPSMALEETFGDRRPLSPFMLRHAAQRALTFESPSAFAWETRIATHRVAVAAAIEFAGTLL